MANAPECMPPATGTTPPATGGIDCSDTTMANAPECMPPATGTTPPPTTGPPQDCSSGTCVACTAASTNPVCAYMHTPPATGTTGSGGIDCSVAANANMPECVAPSTTATTGPPATATAGIDCSDTTM